MEISYHVLSIVDLSLVDENINTFETTTTFYPFPTNNSCFRARCID